MFLESRRGGARSDSPRGGLFGFFPAYVFVVAAVDGGVGFAVGVVVKQRAAFDAFAEKDVGGFGDQLFFGTCAALADELAIFSGDGEVGAGSEFVGADVLREARRIGDARRGVFVIAQNLAGDDLPLAVARDPCVCFVITRGEVLAEDGFLFVFVETDDGV